MDSNVASLTGQFSTHWVGGAHQLGSFKNGLGKFMEKTKAVGDLQDRSHDLPWHLRRHLSSLFFLKEILIILILYLQNDMQFWILENQVYQIPLIASLVMSFQKDIIHLSFNFSLSAPVLTSFCWHCFIVSLFLFLSHSFLAFWLLLILPSLILLSLFLSLRHHLVKAQWIYKWIFIYKLSWWISTRPKFATSW